VRGIVGRLQGKTEKRIALDAPEGWFRRADRATRKLLDICPECAEKLRSGALKP